MPIPPQHPAPAHRRRRWLLGRRPKTAVAIAASAAVLAAAGITAAAMAGSPTATSA